MGKRFLTGLIVVQILVIGIGMMTGVQALADLKQSYIVSSTQFQTGLILQPVAAYNTVLEADLLKTQAVIDQRLDSLSLTGDYEVLTRGGQLQVNLPRLENMQYVVSVLSSVGDIEFISAGNDAPVGQQFPAPATRNTYQTLFTGADIASAELPNASTGQIFYRLTVMPTAAARLTSFIQTQPEGYICMVMDRQVLNCSQMYHWNGQSLEILPDLSSGDVLSLADLSIFINSGPLPTPVGVMNY
jgi:hypothetical protein